jgi:phytol kinase
VLEVFCIKSLTKDKIMATAFLANTGIKFLLLWIVQYGTGSLVFYKDVKVNYTRKINHFALFFIPMYLDTVIPYQKSIGYLTLGCSIAVVSLIIYIQPVRLRIDLIKRMFLSFDRPEDRPYTLRWLSTQIAVGYLVLIPMMILFFKAGYNNLLFVPILINGIGDGLAEPVGIRFGKLKYQTYALFSNRKYIRTIEGSACVFITSVIVILLFKSSFTYPEFICALITMPIVMTLAEAFSPHTWDTPFLFFVGYISLYLIKIITFG